MSKGGRCNNLCLYAGRADLFMLSSFNKNMKALGVLESKWDLIRQKLVRRLLEEQDKVLRSYFAQKGGARSQRGEGTQGQGREHVGACMREEGAKSACGPKLHD
jgi:hypothetical protein